MVLALALTGAPKEHRITQKDPGFRLNGKGGNTKKRKTHLLANKSKPSEHNRECK